MESIRCGSCKALLFKIEPDATIDGLHIKCRRCGALQTFRQRAQSPTPERRGASSEAESARGETAQDTPAEAEAPRPERL